MSDLDEKEKHVVMILGATGSVGSALLTTLAEQFPTDYNFIVVGRDIAKCKLECQLCRNVVAKNIGDDQDMVETTDSDSSEGADKDGGPYFPLGLDSEHDPEKKRLEKIQERIAAREKRKAEKEAAKAAAEAEKAKVSKLQGAVRRLSMMSVSQKRIFEKPGEAESAAPASTTAASAAPASTDKPESLLALQSSSKMASAVVETAIVQQSAGSTQQAITDMMPVEHAPVEETDVPAETAGQSTSTTIVVVPAADDTAADDTAINDNKKKKKKDKKEKKDKATDVDYGGDYGGDDGLRA